jgi:hypothetical protein
MADIKKIMTTAAANIKAVFGTTKANIKKVGSGGALPAAGGGTFKEQMADLGDGPTYEFLFDAVDGSGDLVNTGTISGNATMFYGGDVGTTVSTTSDEFDGKGRVPGAGSPQSSWRQTLTKSTITSHVDRSWVFVWENTTNLGGNKQIVAFAGELGSGGNFGDIKHQSDVYHQDGTVSAGPLDAITATGHSVDPADATDMTGDTGLRNVLIITYELGETDMIFRWKQTGDPPGHTFKTLDQSSTPSPTSTTTVVWAGARGYDAVTNSDWRYIAVVDHVISESEADALFDVAGL